MANKLQTYQQMADSTARQVTGSYQEWTSFLTTAGRVYKYRATCSATSLNR